MDIPPEPPALPEAPPRLELLRQDAAYPHYSILREYVRNLPAGLPHDTLYNLSIAARLWKTNNPNGTDLDYSQLLVILLNNMPILHPHLMHGGKKKVSKKKGSKKRGSVKKGYIKRGSVKKGSIKRGSVKKGSKKRGSIKKRSKKRGSKK